MSDRVIALLIDAENVSPRYIKVISDELSVHGTPAYRRIYGDWTSPEMSSWKSELLHNNITPIQQFNYTRGKNANDSAMIIDAMDILYTGNCDGFCLVSSDSDFTRLASRLRESRMFVIGMGESKTPMAFKSACDTFKYLDVLFNAKGKKGNNAQGKDNKAAKPKPAKRNDNRTNKAKQEPAGMPGSLQDEVTTGFVPLEEIVIKIKDVIEHDSDEEGYMSLSQVGSILGRLYADFDTRNYGFSKLHKLIDYTGDFDTRSDRIPGGGKNLMVRVK